ncbi:hypothetical protein C8F01DRAFT_1252647 [Mycena amicta]|nr:hypothetical protein C8F01DRAFT_1252647 [Mycena amicta]
MADSTLDGPPESQLPPSETIERFGHEWREWLDGGLTLPSPGVDTWASLDPSNPSLLNDRGVSLLPPNPCPHRALQPCSTDLRKLLGLSPSSNESSLQALALRASRERRLLGQSGNAEHLRLPQQPRFLVAMDVIALIDGKASSRTVFMCVCVDLRRHESYASPTAYIIFPFAITHIHPAYVPRTPLRLRISSCWATTPSRGRREDATSSPRPTVHGLADADVYVPQEQKVYRLVYEARHHFVVVSSDYRPPTHTSACVSSIPRTRSRIAIAFPPSTLSSNATEPVVLEGTQRPHSST